MGIEVGGVLGFILHLLIIYAIVKTAKSSARGTTKLI